MSVVLPKTSPGTCSRRGPIHSQTALCTSRLRIYIILCAVHISELPIFIQTPYLTYDPTVTLSIVMYCNLPMSLVALLSFATVTTALPSFSGRTLGLPSSLKLSSLWGGSVEKRDFEIGTNGSEFLWIIQDTYEGQTFFE